MYFQNPFRDFDPFTGVLELPFPAFANQITKKMRNILKARSLDEFENGFEVVDLVMLGRLQKRKRVIPQFIKEISIDEIAERLASTEYESPADLLKKGIAKTPKRRMAGYSQEELFAILALAILGEAQMTYSEIKDEKWIVTSIISDVAEAAEAAAYAEGILMGRSLQQAIEDDRHQQTSEAGKLRDKDYIYWKPRYVSWYETRYIPSLKGAKENRSQAVKRFYEEVLLPEATAERAKPIALQEPGKAEIQNRSKENVIRTLRNHLVKTRGKIASD